MKKLFLTGAFAFVTMITSAQFIAITTLNKVEGITPAQPSTTEVYDGEYCPTTETEDSWNVTDKIGVGYQVNEKLMVGVTMDGEDAYELLGRYNIQNGIFATCIYNHAKDSEDEMIDKMELGVGYSMKVWKNLYIDPNYTLPMKEDEEGNREGSFNLSFSYKF
tara:strand:- start:166 stop:654 length:489 start_codon:yes stop_codon:yes gene_type:complete